MLLRDRQLGMQVEDEAQADVIDVKWDIDILDTAGADEAEDASPAAIEAEAGTSSDSVPRVCIP
jgi:hypothetical protein